MNFLKSIVLSLLLIIFPSGLALQADEGTRFLVNSSHTGAVRSLQASPDGRLLFSGGDDGTVRIWNLEAQRLEGRLAVSHLAVTQIAIHPEKNELAVLETDGISIFRLSVWNWTTRQRLFYRDLSEAPLHLAYSPAGSYLIYSKTDWESVTFLDPREGITIPLLARGFGIVTAAFLSPSEKTLLSYHPSGAVQYWDLPRDEQKMKVNTYPNLDNVVISATGRYLAGRDGRTLRLIDLVSGSQIDSLLKPELLFSVFSRSGNSLLTVQKNGIYYELSEHAFSSSGFSESPTTKRLGTTLVTGLAAAENNVFISLDTGELLEYRGDTVSLFADNVLLHIDDFLPYRSGLLITAEENLYRISTSETPELERVLALPEEGEFGLAGPLEQGVLLWQKSGLKGRLFLFEPARGLSPLFTDSEGSFLDVNILGDKILTLNRNGTCRIIAAATGEELFHYSSFGLRSTAFLGNGNIIAGRSSTSSMRSTLLFVNTGTGETVPIEDTNLLVYDLVHEPLSRTLYTLGFEQRGGKMRTVLKKHIGRTYEHIQTLAAFPGEDTGAQFALDPQSGKVFTSLGYQGIQMIYWNGFTPLEESDSVPRELKIGDNQIIALNRDRSVSLWSTADGTKVMDLFLFKEGKAEAVTPGMQESPSRYIIEQ